MKKCEHPNCDNDAVFKRLSFGTHVCLEHLDYCDENVTVKIFELVPECDCCTCSSY